MCPQKLSFAFASGGDQDAEEDSKLCQELMANVPHGQDDASKYWSRSLRMYTAQSHPEEFALVGAGARDSPIGTVHTIGAKNLQSIPGW